jgi:hypothetical protein
MSGVEQKGQKKTGKIAIVHPKRALRLIQLYSIKHGNGF